MEALIFILFLFFALEVCTEGVRNEINPLIVNYYTEELLSFIKLYIL